MAHRPHSRPLAAAVLLLRTAELEGRNACGRVAELEAWPPDPEHRKP